MLNIEEAYQIMGGSQICTMWDGWIACSPTNKQTTLSTNKLDKTVRCFRFTVIRRGKINLTVGEFSLTLLPGELFIHLPGYPIRIKEVSDNYEGFCLAIDEEATYRSPAIRKIVQSSSLFFLNMDEPILKLSPEENTRIVQLMQMISDYIQHPSSSTGEVLNNLLSIFLLNLHDSLECTPRKHRITKRDEAVFMSFYDLLRHNFLEQRRIAYYADQLNMTPTHLSRIVKSLTGRTVIDFIDQLVMMEAIWLLLSTELTVSQIADRLKFASVSSFDKFFTRVKGQSPKQVREGR